MQHLDYYYFLWTKEKKRKEMLDTHADMVLKSEFVKAKTMDEFKQMLQQWQQSNESITDANASRLYLEVAATVISTNPAKTGSKLKPSGTFYTVDIQRLLQPHTKTVMYWASQGATEDDIKEVLTQYVKRILY